jgi:hypothetical protein
MGALEAVLYRKVYYSGIPAFDRGCHGKIPHFSEQSARKHAKRLRKLRKKHYDVYLCQFCDCHHVGASHKSARLREAA